MPTFSCGEGSGAVKEGRAGQQVGKEEADSEDVAKMTVEKTGKGVESEKVQVLSSQSTLKQGQPA